MSEITCSRKLMRDFFLPNTLTFMRPGYIFDSALQFPLMVNIEPTNDCTLRCFMCPRRTMKRKVGYMDFELYKSIIDESVRYGRILVMNFHKDGESCLHPLLPQMLAYAKNAGKVAITHFNTNATVLNEPLIAELIKSGLDDITFSIDAINPETFRKIKGADRLREVEANVLKFVEIRDKLHSSTPILRAKIIACDYTRQEVLLFLEKWSRLLDEAYAQEINTFGGWVKLKQTGHSFPCQSLWYTLAINYDGSVNLCSDDYGGYGPLGNLKEEPLHRIWTGKKMNHYRKLMCEGRRSEIPMCKDCTRWEEGADLSGWLKKRKSVIIDG